ncbi:MAG: hypothetical protein HQ567_26425 [Candidatus Nealsonbacteria bacterium]|nr:hypothetical protein [Candidatus Nealsonbacteria bacterium]
MCRPAVPGRAWLGLLVVAIVCTFGYRGGHDLAAGSVTGAPRSAEGDDAEKDEAEDGPTKKDPAEKNPLAGCQQCHVDIEDEYAPSLHFKQKVSCKDCHGPSKGHLADENNEVKPDRLFARKDVDRLCGKCHECARETDDETPGQRAKVCTDCHGPHDLADVKKTE